MVLKYHQRISKLHPEPLKAFLNPQFFCFKLYHNPNEQHSLQRKMQDESKKGETLWPPETESIHVSPENPSPPLTGDPIRPPDTDRRGGRVGEARERERMAQRCTDGWSDDFLHTDTNAPPPYSSSYPLALQARHTCPMPHTHTHTRHG